MQTKPSARRIFGSPAGLLASAILAVPLALFTAGAASAATPHTVQLKTHSGQQGQHSTVQLTRSATVQLKARTVQLTSGQLKPNTVQLGQHDTVQLTVQL